MTEKMKVCNYCKHCKFIVTPGVYKADICSYHWEYYVYCTLHRKKLINEYDETEVCSDYEEETGQ